MRKPQSCTLLAQQFQDLIELKGLDAAAKFMNANILISGAGCEKWQQA
jgi:hypothetical protein